MGIRTFLQTFFSDILGQNFLLGHSYPNFRPCQLILIISVSFAIPSTQKYHCMAVICLLVGDAFSNAADQSWMSWVAQFDHVAARSTSWAVGQLMTTAPAVWTSTAISNSIITSTLWAGGHPTKLFTLELDASCEGIGAVMSQEIDHVVCQTTLTCLCFLMHTNYCNINLSITSSLWAGGSPAAGLGLFNVASRRTPQSGNDAAV